MSKEAYRRAVELVDQLYLYPDDVDAGRMLQASAHHVLNEAAQAALRQWRFSALPAKDAQVEQWGILTIVFRLQ